MKEVSSEQRGPDVTTALYAWRVSDHTEHRYVGPPGQRALATRIDVDLRPLRYLGTAMLALGLLLPHLPGDPGPPCPLRTVTGVPCPLCGMTTSVKAALRGHLHTALAANPFGILAVMTAVVLLARPTWRRLQVPVGMLAGTLAVSWLFELHRFHFI
jgi:hypothetical protein